MYLHLLAANKLETSNRLCAVSGLTCVDGAHHLLKHLEADVGHWNNASLLLFVMTIKHGPAGLMSFSTQRYRIICRTCHNNI